MSDNIKTGFGKYIWIIGVITLLGTGGLFAYLESLGLQVECEDKLCEVGQVCEIYCTVKNPTSKSVYLFNHDDWKIQFSPDVVDVDVYWKYYGKWRYTNFTRATRAGNIPDARKYVFVFPRYSTKEFKLNTIVSEPTRIKWNFGVLDPIIVSYDYKYENLIKVVDVYCEEVVEVKSVYFEKNDTTIPGYKHSYDYKCDEKIEYYDGKLLGIDVGNKKIEHTNFYLDTKNNKLVEWSVPIGDRNMNLFGNCDADELRIGVCKEEMLI